MEANRDGAEQYFDLGKDAMAQQDYKKALDYFEKSKKLFPLVTIGVYIQKCHMSINSSKSAPVKKETNSVETPREDTPQHSKEEIAEIQKIIKMKDYYKILGVEKTAKKEDITRAYRKLAMKFHPDRNRCPGAEDAFKVISGAYSCLNDEKKRGFYDQFGTDDPQKIQQQQNPFGRGGNPFGFHGMNGQHFHYSPFDDDQEDMDEILRTFFSGFPRRRRGDQQQARRQEDQEQRPRNGEQTNFWNLFIQILPFLLIFFVFPMLGSFFGLGGNAYPYSLNISKDYPIERTTQVGGVQYYVRSTFDADFRKSNFFTIARMEQQVIRDSYQNLLERCDQEKAVIAQEIRNAQRYLNGEARTERIQYAEKLDTPSCTRVQEYQKLFNR